MFFFLNTTTIYSYPGHGFQIINQRFYHSNKFELQSTSFIAQFVEVSVTAANNSPFFKMIFT